MQASKNLGLAVITDGIGSAVVSIQPATGLIIDSCMSTIEK